MAKKTEDLSALRARVETYKAEIKQSAQEFAGLGARLEKVAESRPLAPQDVVDFLKGASRHANFMEKYEAALVSLVAALEKRVKQLEKKVPKYDLGIDR